jgi:GTP-binding protein
LIYTPPPALTLDDARKLFAAQCDFVRAISSVDQCPSTKLPEVAFWGRSNVGKSSLINGLTGRAKLARSSKTPGRTQEIIFFDLGGRLMLVDLPGYGHAKAPDTERDRWNDLIRNFLQSRPPLRLVCLLIDGRHGLMTNDLATLQLLDRCGVSYQLILTKIDQVPAHERDKRREQVAAALVRHPAARAEVLMVSAEKKIGIDVLQLNLTLLADKPRVSLIKTKKT